MADLDDDEPAMIGSVQVIGSLNTAMDYMHQYEGNDATDSGGSSRRGMQSLAVDDTFDEEEELDGMSHPQILLMGLRRSGKTSILKVIFHKQQPSETLFLESTVKPYKDTHATAKSFVKFTVWDCPGQLDWTDGQTDSLFQSASAIIFLIDAQDDYMDALARFNTTVQSSIKQNSAIAFDVFIHKVDGLTDDQKTETQRDIHQRVTDALREMQIENVNVHVSFHLTSIYDHSVFEAFSKVVQKLVPELPTVENLLDMFIASSGIEKVFVFDINSKIYVATDSQMVDTNTYELCCDMIDVVLDVAAIYGGQSTCASSNNTALTSTTKKLDDGGSRALRSTIKLSNALILSLRQVNECLALVFIMREDAAEKEGLIEYNFEVLKKAILDVFAVHRTLQRSLGRPADGRNADADLDDAASFERDEDFSHEGTPNPHTDGPLHVTGAKNVFHNNRLLVAQNHVVN